jgi:hypothetical protein
MQFLKVVPEARGSSMADAVVSLAQGLNSIFWNPSGLSEINKQEFEAGYIDWIFDTYQAGLTYGFKIKKFDVGIGFQFQYISYGEIEETRVENLGFIEELGQYNPGLTGRIFEPKAWLIGLSFAKPLTDRFSVGVGVKYAVDMLWEDSKVTLLNPAGFEETFNTYGRALLFDFGISYKTGFKTVKVGAAVQNFGPQVKYAKEKFPAPLIFRLGISSYIVGEEALLAESRDLAVLASYDIVHPNDYDQQMGVGVELSFKDAFFLRIGKKINYDTENLTFGAGVKIMVASTNVIFNYCYQPLGKYLGKIHKLNLGIEAR